MLHTKFCGNWSLEKMIFEAIPDMGVAAILDM